MAFVYRKRRTAHRGGAVGSWLREMTNEGAVDSESTAASQIKIAAVRIIHMPNQLMRFFPAILLWLSLPFNAIPQGRRVTEGERLYTPTRLEWLALDMNARLRRDFSATSSFSMDFAPVMENTILIVVHYLPNVNRTAMNMSIASARKVIEIDTRARGWSSWVRIKEQVEMTELDKPKQ
jgi:hypothetical protein